MLVEALEADGPAGPRELDRRVRARYWGPGQFRRAVRHGVRTGRLTTIGGRLQPTGAGAGAGRR